MKRMTIIMWDPGYLFMSLSLDEQIQQLATNLNTAYTKALEAAPAHEKIVVLFLCPEFTFLNHEKSTESHAYSKEQFDYLKGKLLELAIKHPQAIIVPGTGYFEKKLDLTKKQKKQKYANIFHLHEDISTSSRDPLKNLAIALADKDKLKDKTIVKNSALFFSKNAFKRYSKQHAANELILSGVFYPGHASTFFKMKHIKFGVEICQDHLSGTLRAEQKQNGDKPIDVHIIIGNVMTVIPGRVANDRRDILIVNCAGNFAYDNLASEHSAVWIGDQEGNLIKVPMTEDKESKMRIFSNVTLPEHRYSPLLLAKKRAY